MSSVAFMPQSLFSTPELVLDDRSFGLYDFETNVLSGSILYDTFRADETARASVPRAAPAPFVHDFDMSLETTEEVFADLEAACSARPSDDPLVMPPRPFYPYDPAETAETDSEEEAREPLPPPAPVAKVDQPAVPTYESDDSSSDSESDSDSDYYDGALTETNTPRVICALPGRVAPKSSLPAPRPRAAPLSVDSTPTPIRTSKKRAARKARVAAAKKRAVASTSTSPTPVAVAVRPANTALVGSDPTDGENLPYAHLVPHHLQYLLRLGCTPLASGSMSCYKADCTIVTRIADMDRHVVVHNRAATQVYCIGCPQTFSRPDPLKRHLNTSGGATHTSTRRRAALLAFNKQAEIVALRAQHPLSSASQAETTQFYKDMNKTLNSKFSTFLATNPQF
ncbi:hypothetical protein B0H16DRAFT_1838108 [Mycena metata]|uniref:C2H2-type domain-containing protein n=1 Tax=Mycena metata TaxID=1033252 RepID=A0AAD7NWQ5_9AGAR|nr:hypothetical protein B0H16DRAFT_1838108 [Mycena metata]